MLSKGSEYLREQVQLAERLGVTLDPGAAEKALVINEKLKDLSGAFEGLRNSIVESLIDPMLTVADILIPKIIRLAQEFGYTLTNLFGAGGAPVTGMETFFRQLEWHWNEAIGLFGGDPNDSPFPTIEGVAGDMRRRADEARIAASGQRDGYEGPMAWARNRENIIPGFDLGGWGREQFPSTRHGMDIWLSLIHISEPTRPY